MIKITFIKEWCYLKCSGDAQQPNLVRCVLPDTSGCSAKMFWCLQSELPHPAGQKVGKIFQWWWITSSDFRKRSINDSDNFFSDSDDDDWFDSEFSDDVTVSEECQNFTLPKIKPEQMVNLVPLAQKYKTEGFSSEVGEISGQYTLSTPSILRFILTAHVNFSKSDQPKLLPRALLLPGGHGTHRLLRREPAWALGQGRGPRQVECTVYSVQGIIAMSLLSLLRHLWFSDVIITGRWSWASAGRR